MGAAIGQIVFGLIESLLGRRLFWIFVAIGGFAVGWFLIPGFFDGIETWARILIGVVVGVVFAVLALWFTRFMVAVSGFFLFGTVTVLVVRWLGGEAIHGSTAYWIAFLVGGVVGAIIVGIFFNWALIILTSLVGSGSVATGITYLVSEGTIWLQVVLFVVFPTRTRLSTLTTSVTVRNPYGG